MNDSLLYSILENMREVSLPDTIICKTIAQKATEESFFSWNMTLGNILTILSLIITLLIFNKSQKQNKENQRRSWLLNVVIQPQLKNTEDFYKKISKSLCDSIKKLAQEEATKTAKDFQKSIAEKQHEIKNDINEYFNGYIDLLKCTHKTIYENIKKEQEDLTDKATHILENYSKTMESDITSNITKSKQNVISNLYKGIEKGA